MRRIPLATRQRGIALVTALLMVALATTAAVQMISSQQLDIRRVQNVLAREQAYSYAVAAESWALHILRDKLEQEGADRDHLGQDWAQPVMLPEFDGARLTMQIHDEQARFNLNNLANIAPGETENIHLQRFIRLLELHGAEAPVQLANAVMDWLDPDMDERPGGAEDGAYTQLEQPYRAANRPMASASELRVVQGVSAELYHALEPHITALPAQTHLNVNTASATVLRLIHTMDEQTADALVEQRPDEGYEQLNDLLQNIPQDGVAIQDEGLGLNSQFFRADITVELGPARVRVQSLIARGADGNLRVLARSQGPL